MLKSMPFYSPLNRLRCSFSQYRFERQRSVTARIGKFDIEMPSAHLLLKLLKSQPYRDLCIGITAKYLGGKYPSHAVLDIGANVGDSAAHIASYCANDLILIEPSPFFDRYLRKNVRVFPNKSVVENVFISPEDILHGRLIHWGGTAVLERGAAQSEELVSKKLSAFNQSICMVKIDTDGNDFSIINDAISWLVACKPGIVFEHQIRSEDDLDQANTTFENLMNIGYRHFAIFDDPGFLILATDDVGILKDLNRYQYRIWSTPGAIKSISNYDVLALHEKDRDVFENVLAHYRQIRD